MTLSRLAQQNDAFRMTPPKGTARLQGEWVMTPGVRDLGPGGMALCIIQVTGHRDFTADNDPHGEHDFGSFEVGGQKLFWKIDCYARDDFSRGSEDPADPAKTTRVMTIMLASEY